MLVKPRYSQVGIETMSPSPISAELGSGLKPHCTRQLPRLQMNTSQVKCMCGGLTLPCGIDTPPNWKPWCSRRLTGWFGFCDTPGPISA